MLTLDSLTGQATLKQKLRDTYLGSLALGEKMPHGLLLGPRGMGKTTYGRAIASEVGVPMVFEGSAASDSNIDSFIMRIACEYDFGADPGFVFLDEIHILRKDAQNRLLTLMTEGVYTDKQNNLFPMPFLTLIGATTDKEILLPPFVDRFIAFEMDAYSCEELARLGLAHAERKGYKSVTYEWCLETAMMVGVESPRHMIYRVEQCARLGVQDKEHSPDAVALSMGYDEYGMTSGERMCIIAMGGMHDAAALHRLANVMRLEEREVRPILTRLSLKGYVEVRRGVGARLTPEGVRILHTLRRN